MSLQRRVPAVPEFSEVAGNHNLAESMQLFRRPADVGRLMEFGLFAPTASVCAFYQCDGSVDFLTESLIAKSYNALVLREEVKCLRNSRGSVATSSFKGEPVFNASGC